MKSFLTLLLLIAALAAGWFLRGQFGSTHSEGMAASGGRKVLFYQSAMHPWVKNDKPGRCTICGMELTPVYEGEKGLEADGDTVVLTQSQIQVLHVETAEARVQPLRMTLRVAGSLEDDTSRHRVLSAYIDGRIDRLHVNFMGAEVREGQPLAEIYSPALLQAERDYRQLTGELKKNTGLRLRQMGLTPAQIEALETKSGDALTSQILAPVSGTVVEQKVFEGQYVKEGDKLFEIADFSTMWFQFRAYEQDMPWIQTGQGVTVSTPSLPGQSFEGKVTFIDPNFDEATRSTKVRVELANPLIQGRRVLLYRLYADGDLKVDVPSVLAVPRSAVIETGPQAVVYVEQGGGAYVRTPVRVGRRGDTLVEVIVGINPGDHVVTNGNLLIDGQAEMNRSFMAPVEPVKPSAPPATLTEKQQQAISAFIKVADSMAVALAADDLPAFSKAADPAMMATGDLVAALRSPEGISERLDALDKARHFHGFDDIAQARVAFHKLSSAATAVLEPLRMAEGAPPFDVWECFMVDQIIPGVPANGRWLQRHGRSGENPYFGKAMLECAKEIKRGVGQP